MASLSRNGGRNQGLPPLLKRDLRGPGSRVPAVSACPLGGTSKLLSPGQRGFLTPPRLGGICKSGGVCHPRPPLQPRRKHCLRRHTVRHNYVWHGGAGRGKPDRSKQRSTGAFPLGQFVTALLYFQCLILETALRRQGRETRGTLTPTEPLSPSHGVFPQTATRGLPCFSQRKRNCGKMTPLEKILQSTLYPQTVVWRAENDCLLRPEKMEFATLSEQFTPSRESV